MSPSVHVESLDVTGYFDYAWMFVGYDDTMCAILYLWCMYTCVWVMLFKFVIVFIQCLEDTFASKCSVLTVICYYY